MAKKNDFFDQIIEDVFKELKSSIKQHPIWPEDVYKAIAIITEELGELSQAALNENYENIRQEAIQVTAMGLRFLVNIRDYKLYQN